MLATDASGSFSDLVFLLSETTEGGHVIEHEIKAHKVVVGARSEYFANMFRSGMKEANQLYLSIQEFDVETFKRVIKWIYTDTIDVNALYNDLKSTPSLQDSALWHLWKVRGCNCSNTDARLPPITA